MSCTFDAILPFEDVNSLPLVDFDKCTGCAVCAGICPGLAIFIVDESKPGDFGTLRLPYEYWPLPEKGQTVMALSREGGDVEPVEVVAISNVKGARTPLVTLRLPKDKLQDIRGFRFPVSYTHLAPVSVTVAVTSVPASCGLSLSKVTAAVTPFSVLASGVL